MAQTLRLNNFNSLNILAQTMLTNDVAAGVNALPVVDSSDFGAGSIVIAGYLGSNSAELLTAASPADDQTVSTTGNTLLPHNNGESISSLFGSSINIYRAENQYTSGQQPDDDNFTPLTTVTIDPSSSTTTYTDPSGGAGYWYKYTYLNPTTSSETDLASSVATAADSGNNYCSLDLIRSEAGFNNRPKITDAMIDEKRQAAQKEIVGALEPVYQFPLPQPTNPLVEQVAIKLAAGLLMEARYMSVSPAMAANGTKKAADARMTLDQLVVKDLVLTDAQFNELAEDEAHGFGGYPDSTAPGHSFKIDTVY
jgi:hypothetical protein